MLTGARNLRVLAPLSSKDTLDLEDAHREALSLVEAASLGLGLAHPAAVAVAHGYGPANTRQDKALKWAQGVMAKVIEERESRIR